MLDVLISGLCELLGVCLEAVVDLFTPVFGFDISLFNESFPFAGTAYTIFQSVALGIVLLLAATQIIPFFFGSQQKNGNPIKILLYSVLAVFAIYYGNYILDAIIDISQMPYNALLSEQLAYGSLAEIFDMGSFMDVLFDAAYMTSSLLYLILLLVIGIAFVKLLLEAIERYVILFVLMYMTPLAASTMASEQTSNIFKRFFTMFISQCILLILNVWSLQMFSSLFASMGSAANPMITMIMGYAFLRIATRMDSYLNALGLNAAVTGAGLGSELMAAGMMIMARGSSFMGGKGSGGGQGILGAAKSLGNAVGSISPVSGVADAAKNFVVGGVGKTAVDATKAAVSAAGEAGSGKFQAGAAAFTEHFKTNFGKNKHDAFMKTQDQNLLMRNLGQTGAELSDTDKSVRQSMETMFSQGTLSDQELHDISRTPFAAAQAFNNVPDSSEVSDSAAVSATMQGLGLNTAIPEADEAVQVGYGNINASGVEYSMTSSGAKMAYTANGKGHQWEIRNKQQYNSLPSHEQNGYTKFKATNGKTFYAKHTNQNDQVGAMFSRMQATNSSMSLSGENKNQFTDFLSSTKWSGISPKTVQEINTAVQGGAGNVSGGADSRRFWIETDKGFGVSIISSNGIDNTGNESDSSGRPLYDTATLESRGYTYNKINGKDYWVKESTEIPADSDYDSRLFNER